MTRFEAQMLRRSTKLQLRIWAALDQAAAFHNELLECVRRKDEARRETKRRAKRKAA